MKTATSWTSVLTPGDGDPRHGHNGYTNLGCRCELCRAAQAAYARSMRKARAQRLAADPTLRPHGVDTTYRNYGCRCPDCTHAHSRARRRWRDHAPSP